MDHRGEPTPAVRVADPERRAPWAPSLRGVRAAFTVLTRIPVGGFPYSDEEWQRSAAHLPLVGSVLGALLGGVWLASVRAGYLVAAVVVVAASLLLTGAMHEDGLADTADALGGGSDRERVLAILKDSRIGAFGSAALTVAILLRVALLARLGPGAPVALAFTQCASRLVPVWLMAALPYVTDAEVAKSRAVVATSRAEVVVATAWVTGLGVFLGLSRTFTVVELVVPAGVAGLVALVAGRYFRARVGGITGDFLGASQQLTECGMLLALAVARGGSP
jgi:adenosylcobinamide-GDP ribazoletransferase